MSARFDAHVYAESVLPSRLTVKT